MVTTAILLFTVSTLAAHINAVPTKELNNDPCEGKTLCFEKPADYPQEEEMNHIVAHSDLRQFYQVKRVIREAIYNIKDNSCVDKIEEPLYTLTDVKSTLHKIVEAKSFRQFVPNIICKTKKPCLEQFEKNSKPLFECQPVISKVNITMVLKGHKKATDIPNDITTDCRCGKRIEQDTVERA